MLQQSAVGKVSFPGGSGEPLNRAARAFFEPRFGFDFSRVRIHVGSEAARAAEELGARAYAWGDQIVFARGEYDPVSRSGRQLLAHELAHVIQQGSLGVTGGLVQRQPRPGEPAPAETSSMTGPQAWIGLICEIIRDVRAAVLEGRTWSWRGAPGAEFPGSSEREDLLLGEVLIGQPNLLLRRRAALQEMIDNLQTMAAELQSGALALSGTPDRWVLMQEHHRRHPELFDRPMDWTTPGLSPATRMPPPQPPRGWQPGMEMYMRTPATSPPGVLPPSELELPWWGPRCEPEVPQPPPVRCGDVGPYVYVFSDANGVVTGWDEEAPAPIAPYRPRGPYVPERDPTTHCFFVVLQGQRIDLLDYGRVRGRIVLRPGQ